MLLSTCIPEFLSARETSTVPAVRSRKLQVRVRIDSMVLVAFFLFQLFSRIESRLQPSLNHPRVLLPYAVDDESKSSVVLTAHCPSKCCFNWSVSLYDETKLSWINQDEMLFVGVLIDLTRP